MDDALGTDIAGLLKDADEMIEDVGMDGVSCEVNVEEEEEEEEEEVVGNEDLTVDDKIGGLADAAADVVDGVIVIVIIVVGLIDLDGNVDDTVVVLEVCIEGDAELTVLRPDVVRVMASEVLVNIVAEALETAVEMLEAMIRDVLEAIVVVVVITTGDPVFTFL